MNKMNNSTETPTKKAKRSRRVEVEYEQTVQEPENWRELYDTLKQFRYNELPPAPVDTMGCDKLYSADASPAERRFQILISLVLSPQTKDQITAEAMRKLHIYSNAKKAGLEITNFEDINDSDIIERVKGSGLTIESVLESTQEQLRLCIYPVGFHNTKSKTIIKIARICRDSYNDDIPATQEELLALPGVGPKIAYLALQAAWGKVEGIGVDTHVHRISSRLGWVPKGTEAKGPEATRAALEAWLPREYWNDVNPLLVGLGQTICKPRIPQCDACAANLLCPSSSVLKKSTNNKKKMKKLNE